MRIAILDTYYPKFLAATYRARPELSDLDYAQHLRALLDQCFGTSDYYSHYLNQLGCDARDIVANSASLQSAWLREQGSAMSEWRLGVDTRITRLPVVGNLLRWLPGLTQIVARQIREWRPDVLYCQDMSFLPPATLHSLRQSVRLVVGQIASPSPPPRYLKSFDLILTSFPHFVTRYRQMGLKSEYFRIGFDERILTSMGSVNRDLATTFVGGITAAHGRGTQLLETLARLTPMEFFGYGRERLDANSPVHTRHHGEVWGHDMYRALARSRITLNRHIDVAENYANNMRLYEATGMGAMLVTDRKDNLGELFDIGTEVMAYGSAEEAAEVIRYHVDHPDVTQTIATAGQARTLRDHTYRKRMEELIPILRRHLGASHRAA